jgi:hypothetical protein
MNETQLKRMYRIPLNTHYREGNRPPKRNSETVAKIRQLLAPLEQRDTTLLQEFKNERSKGSLLLRNRQENNGRLLCEVTARVLENHDIPTTTPLWMWLMENTSITCDWRGFIPFPIKGGVKGVNPLTQETVSIRTNQHEEMGEFIPKCTIRDLRERYGTTPAKIKRLLWAAGLSDINGNPDREPDHSYMAFYGNQNVYLWPTEMTMGRIDKLLFEGK